MLVFPIWAQHNHTVVSHQVDTVITKGGNMTLQVDTITYISNPSQNYFFQLQAGVSHSMSENVRFYPFFQAEKPAVIFSVGKFFFPQFGLRLSMGWINQISFVDKNVRKNMPPDMHSVFGGIKENRRFSIIGVLGLGYLRTFGFSDMATKWNERHNYLVGLLGQDYRNKVESYIDENGNGGNNRVKAEGNGRA